MGGATGLVADLAPGKGLHLAATRGLDQEALAPLLLPRKGRFGIKDYEKVFTPDLKTGPDIFTLRGIDRAQGALVVVRPDQFVATVLPLDAHEALAAYFERFMLPV